MQDITSLVVQTIHDKLPTIPIYRERVPTAFSEPSFVITRSSTSFNGEPNGYTMRTYAFDVAYFPKPTRSHEDIDIMAEWLMVNLKIIEPNYAMVINGNLNVTDDILHYTFDIRARIRDEFERLFNQNLDYQGGLKNGQ